MIHLTSSPNHAVPLNLRILSPRRNRRPVLVAAGHALAAFGWSFYLARRDLATYLATTGQALYANLHLRSLHLRYALGLAPKRQPLTPSERAFLLQYLTRCNQRGL